MYLSYCRRKLLQQEFKWFPAGNIDNVLRSTKYLSIAYGKLFILQEAIDTSQQQLVPLLKRMRPPETGKELENMSKTYHDLLDELEYAKHKAKTQKGILNPIDQS